MKMKGIMIRDPSFKYANEIWNQFLKRINLPKSNWTWKAHQQSFNNEIHFKKLLKAFKHFAGKNVLDAGCEYGLTSFLISCYAKQVVGIDNRDFLTTIWNTLHSLINNSDIVFQIKEIFDLTTEYFKQHKFDAALVSGLSESLGRDGLTFLYRTLYENDIDIIVASSYGDAQVQIDRYPILKNYNVIGEEYGYMILQRIND